MEQRRVLTFFLAIVPFSSIGITRQTFANSQNAHNIKEVRHELATLPYYGVFDWLEFEVRPDNTVVLRGQVVRPTTKSEAESRVKDVEGVSKVVNEIEVLPLSPMDDRLRRALYRTIYGQNSPLFRYAIQATPSIHIIVKNGRAAFERHCGQQGRRATGLYEGARCAGSFRSEE